MKYEEYPMGAFLNRVLGVLIKINFVCILFIGFMEKFLPFSKNPYNGLYP